MEQSGPRSVRKRACYQCAVQKAKCTQTQGLDKCDRCERLNKDCTARAAVPRKRRTRQITEKRVAELEEKVEKLESLLPPGSDGHGNSNSRSPFLSNNSEQVVRRATGAQGALFDSLVVGNTQQQPMDSNSNSATLPLQILSTNNGSSSEGNFLRSDTTKKGAMEKTHQKGGINLEKGVEENLLYKFREQSMTYFPFVAIPLSWTTSDLEKEKPLLWRVIIMITYNQNTSLQASLGKTLLEELTARLLLHGDKNIELLQSLLLFTAWNHHQFTTNPQMTNLLYLLKGLVTSLRLDRAKNSVDRRKIFSSGLIGKEEPVATKNTTNTLEEQRALLGCFYFISSKGILDSGRIDTLQFTPYMERCCQALEDAHEYRHDALLVYLIRLQRIVETIVQTLPRDERNRMLGMKAPVAIYVKALQAELNDFKSSLPQDLRNNVLLLMNYHAAEVLIYEDGLYDIASPPELTTRCEILYNCLRSTKAYFDAYHLAPRSHYENFPFTVWMQSGLMLMVASQLSLLDLNGWSRDCAQKALCVEELLDHEINRLEGIIGERKSDVLGIEGKDIFYGFLQRMRKIKSAYKSQLDIGRRQDVPPIEHEGFPLETDDFATDDPFSYLEDALWQNFGNDSWTQACYDETWTSGI